MTLLSAEHVSKSGPFWAILGHARGRCRFRAEAEAGPGLFAPFVIRLTPAARRILIQRTSWDKSGHRRESGRFGARLRLKKVAYWSVSEPPRPHPTSRVPRPHMAARPLFGFQRTFRTRSGSSRNTGSNKYASEKEGGHLTEMQIFFAHPSLAA